MGSLFGKKKKGGGKQPKQPKPQAPPPTPLQNAGAFQGASQNYGNTQQLSANQIVRGTFLGS